MITEVNGRWTCSECGYEWSACISDDQVPEICECEKVTCDACGLDYSNNEGHSCLEMRAGLDSDTPPVKDSIKVSIDGGLTWQDAPQGVKIMYDGLLDPVEDFEDCSLLVNATDEGLIMDVWAEQREAEPIGTSSEMAQEIVDRIVHEQS